MAGDGENVLSREDAATTGDIAMRAIVIIEMAVKLLPLIKMDNRLTYELYLADYIEKLSSAGALITAEMERVIRRDMRYKEALAAELYSNPPHKNPERRGQNHPLILRRERQRASKDSNKH